MPLKFKSFFELDCTDNSIIWRTRGQPPPHPFLYPTLIFWQSDLEPGKLFVEYDAVWRSFILLWDCSWMRLLVRIVKSIAGFIISIKRGPRSLYFFSLPWSEQLLQSCMLDKECQSNPHSGSLLIWQRLTYVGLGIPPLWHF